MQTVKLNCAACGAPISIPEDIDTLICTSCGSKLAVDRGEGYMSLKVVEKITQAIQESGDKAHTAIKENTFVTKVELKRVQISQSINTEEMKLNTLRQEIRSLTRKPQLLPVEVQQLTSLRLDECDILQHIRKFNMDSAKLEDGWEESLELFQSDLAALDEIIKILTPHGVNVQIRNRLTELGSERERCEKHLTDLETRLLSRQLKYLRYGPLTSLSVAEMEKLREDLISDIGLLSNKPSSKVKERLRTEATALLDKLNLIFPRKKVESATGTLKSLDLKPPYPEIPWQLIPMIELVDGDLQKVKASPDNPWKILIATEIEEKGQDLKRLQALDLPAQRVMAEKNRKRRQKTGWIVTLSIIGLIILVAILVRSGVKENRSLSFLPSMNTSNNSQHENTVAPSSDEYEPVIIELFEIVAQRTYLRPEPDINSDEQDELVHGDLLVNLGQSSDEPDWYNVELFKKNASGFLYQQWIKPIHGESIEGRVTSTGGVDIYTNDFSGIKGDWWEAPFEDDFGKGQFVVSNGQYQIDLTVNSSGYIYSSIDLPNLPADFVYSAATQQLSGSGLSASGLVVNFVNTDNFDYFLLTSEGNLIIGMRRNGQSHHIYETGTTPNNAYSLNKNGIDQLSVIVKKGDGTGPTGFTYLVNGKAIFTLDYDHPQEFNPAIGVIVWSMDNNDPISYAFDDISVRE